MKTEIRGWHVLAIFVCAFGVIITVNLTLAFNAVRTFPGLEVRNSYVASQSFDANRAAQLALGWEVSSALQGNQLFLEVKKDGVPIAPTIETAVFGRATHVNQDQFPTFSFDGERFAARVEPGDGNWNLRFVARAADGTQFRQRVIVRVLE